MRKVSFPQFVIGMILGLLIVIGAVGGVGYLYFLKLSKKPPKPDFPKIDTSQKDESAELATVSNVGVEASDSTYVALVVYQDGLILRTEPDSSSEAITTLKFEETVRVVDRSRDEQWEQVFLETTGQRGWVARGNLKRVQ